MNPIQVRGHVVRRSTHLMNRSFVAVTIAGQIAHPELGPPVLPTILMALVAIGKHRPGHLSVRVRQLLWSSSPHLRAIVLPASRLMTAARPSPFSTADGRIPVSHLGLTSDVAALTLKTATCKGVSRSC